ncbi:Protein NARROW LEAF 1 [Linum perenne]
MPSLTLQTTLHPYAPHSESNAAYFSWPTSSRLNDAAEERANYFANLQKGVLPESLGRLPKVHKQWLTPIQCLPNALEGPGGVWCDVDVLEFSYFGAPEPAPKEQLYTDIVDDLRGGNLYIGSGSQVASQETYGTLGAIVRSQTGSRQVGFLTNRHVAVDLDYPNQKMFHPLPPTLGPGVYLGAVERATSFITDDLWYAIFAGSNPETFVRADGAFIPFADDFDLSTVTTSVKGVGEVGSVKMIDLQSPISSLIGKQVMKVGRSSGLTTGTVLAYALEYNDEKGICFFTDFLVVGTNQQTFDLEGDSGSMIMMKGSDDDDDGEKPRPIGIIWGGTANRGRLKLKVGQPPENWTSGVDLGRLLTLLELDLITTTQGLKVAIQEQRAASATGIGSTVEDLSPADGMIMREKDDDTFESLGLQIQHIPPLEVAVDCNLETQLPLETDDDADDEVKVVVAAPPSVEHQFIPNFGEQSALHQESQADKPKNLASLRSGECEDGEEEEETMMISVSLKLGDNNNECKRKRSDVATGDDDEVN